MGAQTQTTSPEFYHVSERDVILPQDGRFELTVKGKAAIAVADSVIGGSTVDLEDRWFSPTWQYAMDFTMISENRGLWNPKYPGVSKGSIEMWVEMVDSTEASSKKSTP